MVGDTTEWSKDEFKLFNILTRIGNAEQQDRNQTQNQNLPKMENQNARGGAQGLPLVGIGSSQTQRKEPHPTVRHLTRFQYRLVLESETHFSIILRLENACSRWNSLGKVRRTDILQ